MSTCLNDAQIRGVADEEATAADRQHAEACGECRARVDAARRAAHELSAMVANLSVPASLNDAALLRRRRRAGATTLRETRVRPTVRMWLTAGAVAAAILAVVFALPPLDAPRAISAAEILDRSLQTLNAASGVELREFDLDVDLPSFAAARSGTYRIEQLVDHDAGGRYRALRYAPDGTLVEGISEDPAAGRRTVLVSVDGQPFAFRLTSTSSRSPSLRDVERHHIRTVIRLLQATAGNAVRETAQAGTKRYIVELPTVPGEASGSELWELNRARAVIDAHDFQIVELSAAGSYLGDTFSVAFRLRNRRMWSSAEVPANQFELPAVANAIAVDGVASEDFGHDLLAAALRELARARR
jgi:hypothetical protein